MEIAHLNKLYYINHVHQYYQDPNDPNKKYFDTKPIGFFYSKKEAIQLIKKYKKLPGFKDYPEGFYIDEYTINSVYNNHINDIIKKRVKSIKNQDVLYSICYQYENEDNHEIKMLAFFSTKYRARKALKELLKISQFRSIVDRLDVYEEHVKRKEWSEGFITWKEAIENKSSNEY